MNYRRDILPLAKKMLESEKWNYRVALNELDDIDCPTGCALVHAPEFYAKMVYVAEKMDEYAGLLAEERSENKKLSERIELLVKELDVAYKALGAKQRLK